ncbi:MAG: 6,7-dimethyl-8-ribityllumazine synthase [Gammaproteobacteria bacterium]
MRVESDTRDGATPLDARGLRVALVAARFNAPLVDRMLAGARAAWARHGGAPEDLEVFRVPGAFELPLACRQAAFSGRYAAVVALGCVIRGDTPHFEYVAGQCAQGLMQAGLETGLPVVFGVLTVENEAQALERADTARLDKGGEAVESAIETVRSLAAIAAGRG